MAIQFPIRGEYIQLDQLLKATGLSESGGAAHAAIADGYVRVDGQVETRKRAKLRPGQVVDFVGEKIKLVAEAG
ncbi:MAG: RNA-binding S4 domain-containing protein [Actinomycetota bacterium]